MLDKTYWSPQSRLEAWCFNVCFDHHPFGSGQEVIRSGMVGSTPIVITSYNNDNMELAKSYSVCHFLFKYVYDV
jgi:hypothetical protein